MRAAGLLGFLLVFASSPLNAGEMYQWVDENGKRHFTDKPPPAGVAAQKSALPVAAPVSRESAAEDDAGPEQASATDTQRKAREKQRDQARQRQEAQHKQRLADEEERVRREQRKAAQAKEEKCKRLKDVADKAYSFKERYEAECK